MTNESLHQVRFLCYHALILIFTYGLQIVQCVHKEAQPLELFCLVNRRFHSLLARGTLNSRERNNLKRKKMKSHEDLI